MLHLTRSLCFLDLETTGTDPIEDRIIELGVDILDPDGARRQWSLRFNPGRPIPPEATEKHHIRDEDVANCPPFREWASRIHAGLVGKDLGGYNLINFDLIMLDEEFRRCGIVLSLEGVRLIDPCEIFHKKEPRNLEAAVRKFCNREHEGAHGAQADSSATVDVFLGQLAAYQDLAGMDLDGIDGFCRGDRQYLDIARKIYLDAGIAKFAFGRHENEPVVDHPDFVDWMRRKGTFPLSTMEALNRLLGRHS